MTTLERLAKLAFDTMIEVQKPWFGDGSKMIWETESQELRDCWVASIRAVVERLQEQDQVMYDGVSKLDKLWRQNNSAEILKAQMLAILEEKP